MVRQFLRPLIEFVGERVEFRQGQLITGFGRVEIVQCFGQYFGHTEQRQSARNLGDFTREGGREALGGEIFVIDVGGELGCNVVVTEKHWGTSGCGGESGNESVSQPKIRLPDNSDVLVQNVLAPKDLLSGFGLER